MLKDAHIKINKSITHVGSIIRIDLLGDVFPPYKDTLVYVGGVTARVTSQSDSIIFVIIPVGVDSGIQNVYVYDRALNIASTKASLEIIYENIVFDAETTKKYATRFAPNPLKTMSVYSRDLAYTNYTEVNDATNVLQNVLSIILTRRGERMFNPNVGTRVMDLLFSLITEPRIIEKELMLEIKTQVETYETRAKIHADKSFIMYDDTHNTLYIVVVVEVPGGATKELGITLSTVRKV